MGVKKCVVHFVGTPDTATIEGNWYDGLTKRKTIKNYQLVGNLLINMQNVTVIEAFDKDRTEPLSSDD